MTEEQPSHEKLTALSTPCMMPDGTEFLTWERPTAFSRTLHVSQRHPQANDANPGTEDAPFATVNAAAQAVRPGERVLVHPGTYREWVRPPRGGESPERMIHFEASAPGEVVLSASEVYHGPWQRSPGWVKLRFPGRLPACACLLTERL